MLKSAIKRKLEKHLNCLELIIRENEDIKTKIDTRKDLDSVWDNIDNTNERVKDAISEIKTAIKSLPETKKPVCLEIT